VLSYHLATGADDHQIKIWDLRYRKELYTLPAHNNLISTVKFEPNNGRFLLSSSFDNTIKVCAHLARSLVRVPMGRSLSLEVQNLWRWTPQYYAPVRGIG
jgi:WD40 repeat protein